MADLETAINALVSRLEGVTSRLEKLEKDVATGVKGSSSAPASSAVDSGDSPASVAEWDELVQKYIPQYLELTKQLGDKDIIAQAQLVNEAIKLEREIIVIATKAKKPSDSELGGIVGPTGAKMGEVKAIREKQAKSHKFFNHLSAISEGIDALGWVAVSPKPGPHVAEAKNQANFYSNKILQEFKGKDQTQVDWVGTFVNGFLKDLQDYIKKFHTTGLSWNPKGADASSIKLGGSTSSTLTQSQEDDSPPPPGPAPEFDYNFNNNAPVETATKGNASAQLFQELSSKGENMNFQLKHVTKDMKNKYNPKPPVEPKETKPKSESTPKATTATPTKPPVLALEGNKWNVQYQVGNKSIVIDQTETKHSVYIWRCKNSTIQIKGKINNIAMDDCERTQVVFENAIASVEIVNCKSVEVQVTGTVPNFAVDKTSGIVIYLSKDAMNAEIITSKSDQMNVCIPTPDGNDIVEMPIPEQYRTLVQNGKLVTHISSHV